MACRTLNNSEMGSKAPRLDDRRDTDVSLYYFVLLRVRE